MGFGLLFLGYFLMLFIPVSEVGLIPNLSVIGCVVMFFALMNLIKYCPDRWEFRTAGPMLAFTGVLSAVTLVLGLFFNTVSLVSDCFFLLLKLSLAIYTILVLLGIYRLSHDVALPKLARRSVRIMSLSAVYGLASLAAGALKVIYTYIITSKQTVRVLTLLHYTDFAAYIIEYIFIFLTSALIFTCYMRICLEGDEDMAPKTKEK